MSSKVLERIFHNWPAKVLSIAAAFLLFFFTNLSQLGERYITVPLEVRLDSSMAIASSVPGTVRVGLRGDSDTVSTLREEEISAYVDLTEEAEPGVVSGPVRVEPVVSSTQLDALEIRVEPDEIRFEIAPRQTRSVEIEPSLSDSPATGYELQQSFLTPSAIEIQGPASKVDQVESVRTETISLAGRRDDFNIRVRLERPDPFISFPGGNTVDFRGLIEERVVLNTFEEIDITVIDLADGLDLLNNLPTGLIRVQGSQLDIEAVQRDQLRLEVVASGIEEAGRHILPVRPRVPAGLLTLRYQPEVVELVVGEINQDEAEESDPDRGGGS